MSLVKEQIKALKNAKKELSKVAEKAIRDNVDVILFFLKEKQLLEGVMSDGSSAPLYKRLTEAYAANPPLPREPKNAGQPWNFTWTGVWIDSLYVKSGNDDGFDILARDGKTRMLEEMAGGRITKLTEKHNNIINDEVILPALFKHFEDSLFI